MGCMLFVSAPYASAEMLALEMPEAIPVNTINPQTAIYTQSAVTNGYTLFETHLKAQDLSANEQEIYAWLSNEELINSLIEILKNNQWKPNQPHSLREGVQLLRNTEPIKKLTILLVKNQTDIAPEEIDFQRANGVVAHMLINTFTELINQ